MRYQIKNGNIYDTEVQTQDTEGVELTMIEIIRLLNSGDNAKKNTQRVENLIYAYRDNVFIPVMVVENCFREGKHDKES